MNVLNVNFEKIEGTNKYRIQGNNDAVSAKQQKESAEPPRELKLNDDETNGLVQTLNETISGINERISFSIDEKTKRIVVRVINPETHEVMREIPTREAMRLLEHLQDFLGMLVDESR